jgi:poly(glycerol-phosphate) alpha-glucosyltransferase
MSETTDASVLILTSRLRPGLDGGHTISTLQRAQLLSSSGLPVTLVTVDLHPNYQPFLEEFRRMGLATDKTKIRNFLEEVRSFPEILRNAANPTIDSENPAQEVVADDVEIDSQGVAWRQVSRYLNGATAFTDFFDNNGSLLFRLPFMDQADWWRAPIVIDVFEATASNSTATRVGGLAGFGALYRAWWDVVVSQTRELNPLVPVVAIAEARQVGELFPGYQGVYLVHTVHSSHTLAPHNWDSPMDKIWSEWLSGAHKYDAVVWLSEQQSLDVEKRLGKTEIVSFVIPNPPTIPVDSESILNEIASGNITKPLRAIMITRLVPVKRVDHAIRAWQQVVQSLPEARLDIYGDGPERDQLQQLIRSLDLEQRVTLHGYQQNAREQARTAICHILTSSYEGQSLAIAEAMALGCPSISYEISYGPPEMISDGRSGLLVPSGDIDALASAIIRVLGDPELASKLSVQALRWAKSAGPQRTLESWQKLLTEITSSAPRAGFRPQKKVANRSEISLDWHEL